jgi:hypothetical protein
MVNLQEPFQRCLVLDFSSFSDSFWKNMSDTKIVVHTLLFPTKKSLVGLEVGNMV